MVVISVRPTQALCPKSAEFGGQGASHKPQAQFRMILMCKDNI